MKSLLIFSFILLLVPSIFASSSEETGVCVNPLFGRCEKFFCSVPFLPAPASKPNTDICPDIPAGSSTCCDQKAYNAITTAFVIGHNEIQNSVYRLIIGRALLQSSFNDLQNLINNVSNAYSYLTPAQQGDVKQGLQTILDTSTTFANAVVADWAGCAEGLLNYWAGIMCFGCTPNWKEYIVENNGDITVVFDLNTCVKLSGACVPFFTDVANYVKGIATGVAQILQILGDGFDFSSAFSETDVCNGDCPTYVCHAFVFGFSYDTTGATFADSSEADSLDGSGDTKRAVVVDKRNKLERGLEQVRNVMNSGNQGTGDKFVKGFVGLTDAVEEVKMVNKRVSLLRSSSGVSNNYTSTGYPGYSNGENSGLNTSVNGSGSILFNWISALF